MGQFEKPQDRHWYLYRRLGMRQYLYGLYLLQLEEAKKNRKGKPGGRGDCFQGK